MLLVGSMEQSECTASFTLSNENPDRQEEQQRKPEGILGGNPGGNPEGNPAAERMRVESLQPGVREPVGRPVYREAGV
jgi:hypothetical protein